MTSFTGSEQPDGEPPIKRGRKPLGGSDAAACRKRAPGTANNPLRLLHDAPVSPRLSHGEIDPGWVPVMRQGHANLSE